MKKNLYLIGGGGHSLSCIDVILSTGEWEIKGIFDNGKNVGEVVHGYPALGGDQQIEKHASSENYFIITIGQIKTHEKRKALFNFLKSKNAKIATIISKYAYVAKNAKIGEGTIVMHHALVNAEATIGENCILNSKSLVEHGVKVGNHCHLSTGCCVNGDVKIEDGVFIGSNAIVKECAMVSEAAVIPAGSFYRG